MFGTFCLKAVNLVAIALKKQKQINHELAARDAPSSTFQFLLEEIDPNVDRLQNNPFDLFFKGAPFLLFFLFHIIFDDF